MAQSIQTCTKVKMYIRSNITILCKTLSLIAVYAAEKKKVSGGKLMNRL